METTTQLTDFLKIQSIQIAAVFGIVLILHWLLRHRSAHIRYLLWLLVAIKCVTPPLVIFSVPVLPTQPEAMVVVAPQPQPIPPSPIAAQPIATANPQPQSSIDIRPSFIDNTQYTISNTQFPKSSITLTHLILAIYAAGGACYFLWAIAKSIHLHRRLSALRRPLPAPMAAQIADLARLWFSRSSVAESSRRVGSAHAVCADSPFTVWLIESISQPFVWGLLRGAIYLPARLQSIETDRQKAVVMHEMAHVVRFDAFVNLLQILIQGIFWFHPLVWLANRFIRAEREKCCDEIAVARLGAAPKEYGSAIVDTLLQEYRAGLPIPTLAVAGPVKNIEDRIKTIMRPNKRFYTRPTAIATLAILTLAALIVPTTVALTQRVTPPDYVLSGLVVDANDKPISGAIVFDDGYGPQPYQKGITDANGIFEYKSWNEEHNITAKADGFQPQTIVFKTAPFDNSKKLNFKLQILSTETETMNPDTVIAIVLGKVIYARDIEPDAIRTERCRQQMDDIEFYRWQKSYRESKLKKLIFRPLLNKYVVDKGIVVSREEIEEFSQAMIRQTNAQQIKLHQARAQLAKELENPDIIETRKKDIESRISSLDQLLAHNETNRPGNSFEGVGETVIKAWKANKSLFEIYGGRVLFQQEGSEPLDAYLEFLKQQETAGYFEIKDKKTAELFWNYFTNDKIHRFCSSPEEAQKYISNRWWLNAGSDQITTYPKPKTAVSLTDGLLAYWKFDEGDGKTAYDATGKYPGTISGAEWTEGKVGGALSFNGADSRVDTKLYLNRNGLAGLTMAAWVYPTQPAIGREQIITCDNGGCDWSLLREGPQWNVFTGRFVWDTRFNVDVNQWQHIAVVFKPGRDIVFYKNGISGSYGSAPGTDGSNNNIAIGGHPGAYKEFFKGKIDEVLIFERALSDEEVQNIYNLTGQKNQKTEEILDPNVPAPGKKMEGDAEKPTISVAVRSISLPNDDVQLRSLFDKAGVTIPQFSMSISAEDTDKPDSDKLSFGQFAFLSSQDVEKLIKSVQSNPDTKLLTSPRADLYSGESATFELCPPETASRGREDFLIQITSSLTEAGILSESQIVSCNLDNQGRQTAHIQSKVVIPQDKTLLLLGPDNYSNAPSASTPKTRLLILLETKEIQEPEAASQESETKTTSDPNSQLSIVNSQLLSTPPQVASDPNSQFSILNSQFVASLPNGVTVELIGLCEHPSEGKPWWKPDGSELKDRPYQQLKSKNNDVGVKLYEIVYRVRGSGEILTGIDTDSKWIKSSYAPKLLTKAADGIQLSNAEDCYEVIIGCDPNIEQTDIAILIGSGLLWNTDTSMEAMEGATLANTSTNGPSAIIAAPIEKDRRVYVNMAIKTKGLQFRAIAIDKSGKMHSGSWSSTIQQNMGMLEAEFDLPLSEIKAIQFQTQQFQPITFKNVSLKPGQKTNVKIETEQPAVGHSERSEESDKLTPPQAASDSNSQLSIVNSQLLSTPPQASADPNSKFSTLNSPFVASLPNGVTVELVGLCEHPSEGKPWWKPDGSELKDKPWDKMQHSVSSGQGRKAYEIALKLNWQKKHTPGFYASIDLVGSRCSGSQNNLNFEIVDLPQNLETTDIHFAVASGTWQTHATQKSPWDGVYVSGVVWQAPIAQGNKTILSVAHNFTKDQNRLVAIDKKGKEFVGHGNSGSTDGKTSNMQMTFDVKLDNIKEFQLQTRPYEHYTFKNVSLHPGYKTDVKIELPEK